MRALFRRPPESRTIDIVFEQAVHVIQLRRHRRARRYTLRIQAATRTIVLTMPVRGSIREAKSFAERNGAWIAARLHRLPDGINLAPGVEIPLRGVPHKIVHRAGQRGTVWCEVNGPERLLCVAGDAPHLGRRLADYLKREAKRDLEAACRRYADELGVVARRVSVRDQTGRWGSCSTTGVLSFSWRLILAPPFVLDYLAAHEVAHLIEMNHSPRFWRLLMRINPDTHRAKGWLDQNGAELHRYGSERDRSGRAGESS